LKALSQYLLEHPSHIKLQKVSSITGDESDSSSIF
jgi:hypothetical protein